MTVSRSGVGPSGPWSDSLAVLRAWDPRWAAAIEAMTNSPWTSGVLPRKFVELVSLAVSVACTNLDKQATRRHIRAALDEGASRDEIVAVFKMATVMAIHACSLGAPILVDEAKTAGAPIEQPAVATPFADKMRAAGQWNVAWDPFVALDPAWTDAAMAAGLGIYGGGVFSAKEIELLSIAFDASYTHMYAPGVRRHVKGALVAGASPIEIMEVLKICVAQGAEACNLGVAILQEELADRDARSSPGATHDDRSPR